jgi:hypothetical protein
MEVQLAPWGGGGVDRLSCWVTVVAAVLWLAFSLFLGFRSLSRQVEGFQRVPIPGQAEVSFAEPRGYTVYVARELDQAHWALSTRRPADPSSS